MKTMNNDVWSALEDESIHSREGGVMGEHSKDVSKGSTDFIRALPRLLLVDDDPFALEAVSHTLRHHLPTVTIETCMNPVSALLRLRAQSFAVVLSDFNMPNMNGLCLLRAAREYGSEASFILMTGDSTDDMLTEGLRLGMFALVDKPLNRAALIPLVQQAIECHRLRQEVNELRQTLIDSGVELGSLMRGLVAEAEKVHQPPLPY